MVAKAAPQEQPEVAALRKKIRGEPLTDDERTLLESTYRTPPQEGPAITREEMTQLLAERARRGE
jgi:hypothetical protein